jgi:hypothetical protein
VKANTQLKAADKPEKPELKDYDEHTQACLLSLGADYNGSKGEGPAQRLALDKMLKGNEALTREIWGLAKQARDTLLEKVFPQLRGSQLVEAHKLELMAKDLGSEKATPLEACLIERVLLCWLNVQWAELYCARCAKGGTTLAEIELADRMLSRAQSRYFKALESLQKMRVLLKAESVLEARLDLAKTKALRARAPRITAKTLGLQVG